MSDEDVKRPVCWEQEVEALKAGVATEQAIT